MKRQSQTSSEKAVTWKAKLRMRMKEAKRTYDNEVRKERDRFGFYKYLEAVYVAYRKTPIKQRKQSTVYDVILGKQPARKDTHPIRAIIDQTCNEKPHAKSRWTRALQYANKMNVASEELLDFFKEKSVVKCAEEMAAIKPAKKQKLVKPADW